MSIVMLSTYEFGSSNSEVSTTTAGYSKSIWSDMGEKQTLQIPSL